MISRFQVEKIVLHTVFHLLVLMAASMSSTGDGGKSDAEILAENAPAVQLWADPELGAAYKPYLDCYAQAIGTGDGSALGSDAEVLEASLKAQARCIEQKRSATQLADHYIATVRPALAERERGELLMRYRRQMGFLSVANWYKTNGRSGQFQAYLERTGRSARTGGSTVIFDAQ